MRSWLGGLFALLYALAFLAAYIVNYRGADWTAPQWLFWVALPYTTTMLKLFGEVDFSSDSLTAIATAAAFCCLLAYVAGALAQAVLRLGFRAALRVISRA